MDSIFMNSDNSKTSDPHRLLLNLSDKNKNKRQICCFIKPQHLLYMKRYKEAIKNNKFKILAPTWNEELELPDGSYSVSVIPDYFEYIKKKNVRQLLIILQ